MKSIFPPDIFIKNPKTMRNKLTAKFKTITEKNCSILALPVKLKAFFKK